MTILNWHTENPPEVNKEYLIAYGDEDSIRYIVAEYRDYYYSLVGEHKCTPYWALPQYWKQSEVLAWIEIPELTIFKEADNETN